MWLGRAVTEHAPATRQMAVAASVRAAACVALALSHSSCQCNEPSPTRLALAEELADDRALALFKSSLALPHFNGGRYALQSSADPTSNEDFNRFVCRGTGAPSLLASDSPRCKPATARVARSHS